MTDQCHRFALLAGRTRRVLADIERLGIELAELNRFGLASKLLDLELQLADLYLELSQLSGQATGAARSHQPSHRGQERFPF